MTTRLHSAALDVDIKHESETGIVTVKELRIKKIVNKKLVYKNEYIQYSADECRIIKEHITEIDRTVHLTKKIFDGEIIDPIRCDYINCAWGMGVAGRKICSGGGDFTLKNCSYQESENDPEPIIEPVFTETGIIEPSQIDLF